MTNTNDITAQLFSLKNEKNAVILAHYYQDKSIQQVADYVGDSLELSRKASETNAGIIVFAGVYFMAETAKILNPDKKVLLPDLTAGCSLADGCKSQDFSQFKAKFSDHVVVSYINCSAEIKAMSDYICTSSNAISVINAIPEHRKILFAPDQNLGRYLMRKTGRDMVLWPGSCHVHEAMSLQKIQEIRQKYPAAKLVAHPECQSSLLDIADFIGSTSKMLQYVKQKSCAEFIIATEAGILYQMQKEVPYKLLIPAPIKDNNSCACSECIHMKKNTLEKLFFCLKNETPEIKIEEKVRLAAQVPIQRMLQHA